MTYFKDLHVCTYRRNEKPWPLENAVGWLGPDHSFPTAKPDEALLDFVWKFCKVYVNQTRGIHPCHLFPADRLLSPAFESHIFERNGEKLLLGSAEIRSFSNRGAIFAAPNLIYHYISTHHYRPLEEFIESLSEGHCPPDPEYFARLEKLGHDWNLAKLA
jgi:hypothetical protein